MKENVSILLLVLGYAVTQVHVLIMWLWPENKTLQLSLFLGSNEAISVPWYVYELSNIFKFCIWTFVWASRERSRKVMAVLYVVMISEFVQFILYIWNRNRSFIADSIIYIAVICVSLFFIMPNRKLKVLK